MLRNEQAGGPLCHADGLDELGGAAEPRQQAGSIAGGARARRHGRRRTQGEGADARRSRARQQEAGQPQVKAQTRGARGPASKKRVSRKCGQCAYSSKCNEFAT
eukprot:5159156-Prymnesium_polylepis.1